MATLRLWRCLRWEWRGFGHDWCVVWVDAERPGAVPTRERGHESDLRGRYLPHLTGAQWFTFCRACGLRLRTCQVSATRKLSACVTGLHQSRHTQTRPLTTPQRLRGRSFLWCAPPPLPVMATLRLWRCLRWERRGFGGRLAGVGWTRSLWGRYLPHLTGAQRFTFCRACGLRLRTCQVSATRKLTACVTGRAAAPAPVPMPAGRLPNRDGPPLHQFAQQFLTVLPLRPAAQKIQKPLQC